MVIILMLLFIADSAANVVSCAASRQKLRRISKVLLMPLLLCVYIARAGDFQWFVAGALLFGWAGDIFMIFKADRRGLAAGMTAFGIGHLFYVAAIFRHFTFSPPVWLICAVPAVFVIAAVNFFRSLRRDIPKGLRPLSLVYGLLLSSVGALSALVFFGGAPGGLTLLLGALLFLISDTILSVETFRAGDSPAADSAVMFSYIAAQAMLVFAFTA